MNDTKVLFQTAFRQAVSADYSFVPEEKMIEYSFSDSFILKTEKIKVRENYFALSKTKKAIAAIAAIIILFTLAGCSVPAVREKVRDFFVATYDHAFGILWKTGAAADELDVMYVPLYIPESFNEISRENEQEKINIVYERNRNDLKYAKIIFTQTLLPEDGLYLGKGGTLHSVESEEITAYVYEYTGYTLVYADCNGYLFAIECRGDIDYNEALKMLASLEKTESKN